MRGEWEAVAQQQGVTDKVQFLGRVSDDDLPRLFASADIFVLPANARAEAFGKVLMEAMATGLPCITTEVGSGTSFIVQDAVTGLVVPKQSPEALATAVNDLLANPEKRRQMGQAGQQRVLQHFSVEQMVARVEAVYRSVLSR
jgi:rhamnosyl/mannosyltransferase